MRLPALSAAIVALCASAALPASAAGLNTASAAHRAIYTLTLSSSRGGEVVAATGTMGYEVIDACDGWAVRQRLSMTLTNTDGQDIQMVSDYATWEAKDGLKFRFHMKQTTDTAVTSQTDGDAKLERTGGPGEAHYSVPSDTTKQLPAGTLFPMAHTSAILAAAQSGKKFLALCRCSTAPTISGRRTAPSSCSTGRSRRPTSTRFCRTCPAPGYDWRSSTTNRRARCPPIRSACATGRTASPTICRWISATSSWTRR